LAASRPFALAAGKKGCTLCRENFAAGLELFGGLGTTDSFGWKQTSQYLAPTIHLTFRKALPSVSNPLSD